MVGAILKATNSSFQKNATFCRSMYVNKVMKLLAFIFEQPSYQVRIMTLAFTVFKQVAQWATIAHLGASIMFGDTIIYDARRQVILNLKQ